MKVEPGELTFKLANVQLKRGFVLFVTDDGTEIITLFVTPKDVKFVVSADIDKPTVVAFIEHAVADVNACIQATITVSTEQQVNDFQEQLDVLGAFPRGQ